MPTSNTAEQLTSAAAAGRKPLLDYRMVVATVRSFLRHNGVSSSAALAFYFLMSLFPFLIFVASALALLPLPHLATRMVHLVSHFVPDQTMPMVQSMLNSTMHTNTKLLSAGFLLAMIAASNAFAAMGTALDTIYEGGQARKFWRGRFSAILITLAVGAMISVALGVMLLGPHFGRELASVSNVNRTFVVVWPLLRYALAISCALASIEVLYYLGPSRQHTWREQLPGSVFAVVVWMLSSGLLGIYLRRFSYMNAMYGTLTSFIVLMIWLQITAAAILLGAELNVQLDRGQPAERAAAPAPSAD